MRFLMPPDQLDEKFNDKVQAYVDMIVQDLPVNEQRLVEIQRAQDNDPICQEVAQYCREGWPDE